MKQLIIILLGLTMAMAAVHEFNAESNFICELCQEIIKATKIGRNPIELTNQFPEVLNMDKYPFHTIDDLTKSNLEICQSINMCESGLATKTLSTHEEHIEKVNSLNLGWTAGVNEKFSGSTVEDIKVLMGSIVDPKWKAPIIGQPKITLGHESLPASFDARTQWPDCADVIGHIRDQSNCGSCWAHGTTEALNDRACIKNGVKHLLSVADTTGCCGFLSCFSMGCNGGQVGTPWSWFKSTGVVTGGDFGDKTLCYPYTMPQCAHHVNSTKYEDCSKVQQVAPGCPETCDSGKSTIDYSNDKLHGTSSYSLGSINTIKSDLVTYGSVTAAFTVYEDFLSYKSGVYKHGSGSALGGHAVKIIGYGNENGQDYWLVNNSWNDSWGDKGTFKIAFGECGIDSQCHAGQA